MPFYEVEVERVQRITYKRTVLAHDEAEAIAIAAEPTAHPSSYDDSYGEVLERFPPRATLATSAVGATIPHGTPDEEARERRTEGTITCKVCGQLASGSLHDPKHGDNGVPHHNFVSVLICAACGVSESMHDNGQGGHPFEPRMFREEQGTKF